MPDLHIRCETWELAGTFTIARGSADVSYTLVVELHENGHVGRGECEPDEFDPAMGEVVAEQIRAIQPQLEAGLSREALQELLPKGPARNAVDCALWDLESKKAGKRAWDLAGIGGMKAVTTAYTLGIDTSEAMAAKAAENKDRALLKVKLDADDCIDRVKAIKAAAPNAALIIDANEGWSFEQLCALSAPLADLGVQMIEQPMPRGGDDELTKYEGPVPLCADESCLDRTSLEHIKGRYQFINIKLDKTGGLTEALLLAEEAENMGLRLMVGCMVGTSLAMAPAMLIAQKCEFVDLDGPLLLAKDRENGLQYTESLVCPPKEELWG